MFSFFLGLAQIDEDNSWDHAFLLGTPDVFVFSQSSGRFGFGSLGLWMSPVEEVEQAQFW